MKYIVYLTGGLGNKLFQISNVLESASKCGGSIEILEDITTFEIEEIISVLKTLGLTINRVQKGSIIKSINLVKRICLKTAGNYEIGKHRNAIFNIVEFIAGILTAAIIKRNVKVVIRGRHIKHSSGKLTIFIGYFQENWKQENILAESLARLSEAIVQEEDVCALHMRRGDYFNNPRIGVLSDDYFISAAKKFYEESRVKKFTIFSDSPELTRTVSHEVSKFASVELQDSDKTPLFTLLQLGKYKKLVISNSTFSWWAANIGSEDKQVIAPSKWFQSMQDPEGIQKSSWLLINSTWFSDRAMFDKAQDVS